MKLSKSFMKRLLIIVLSVFVILPVVLMIVGVPKTLEGFYTLPTGSGKTLTGFDISGLTLYQGDVSYTGLEGEALYCAYGDISCSDASYSTVKTRKMYQELTFFNVYTLMILLIFNANVTFCNSKITLKNDDWNAVSLYEFEDDTRCGLKKNASYTYKQFEFEDGLSKTSNLQGFSTPFTSPPMEISDSYVYIYETDVSYSPCFLFEDPQTNCQSDCKDDSSDKDDDEEDDDDCPSGTSTEKCVADFGTQVGEELCCGQTGVLQKGWRSMSKIKTNM